MTLPRDTLTPAKYRAIKHSSECERGAQDTFKRVYGTPDPDCPKCKALNELLDREMFS